MVEHAGEHEWRGEGEAAEVALYAPDGATADRYFERALPAARLPGVRSPVHAAGSEQGFGHVAVSDTHAAPDLASAPVRGLLLVADVTAGDLGFPARDVASLVTRDLAEAGQSLPALNEAAARGICERGASAAAEDGLIEEEDLAHLAPVEGDPDALGRRSLAAAVRDWEGRFGLDVMVAGDVLDADGAGALDLRSGALALVVRVGSGDLGRLSVAAHRERTLNRIRAGVDFGAWDDLPAAPVETEEAADLLAALRAASNFADGRAARVLYVLRRVLQNATGSLSVRAAWRVGGIEVGDGLVHRRDLAGAGEGQVLVSGGAVAAGTGNMSRSAPPFGAAGVEGRWPWEEAGLLERWLALDRPGEEG